MKKEASEARGRPREGRRGSRFERCRGELRRRSEVQRRGLHLRGAQSLVLFARGLELRLERLDALLRGGELIAVGHVDRVYRHGSLEHVSKAIPLDFARRKRSSPGVALSATMSQLTVELSDVDRGVYETLELRLARHPSESARYLHARALAYALCYEEGITFTRGLFVAEEPAIEVRDLRGDRQRWIDIGSPSAERLHKASKGTRRVVVFTYAAETFLRNVRAKDVHRADELEVYALEPSFLDEIEALTEKRDRWELTRTEGQLYLTLHGKSLVGPIEQRALTDD